MVDPVFETRAELLHGALTIQAQVTKRSFRRRLQDEMGADWTEGRQLAHAEAEAIAHRQMSYARRRVTLAHSGE